MIPVFQLDDATLKESLDASQRDRRKAIQGRGDAEFRHRGSRRVCSASRKISLNLKNMPGPGGDEIPARSDRSQGPLRRARRGRQPALNSVQNRPVNVLRGRHRDAPSPAEPGARPPAPGPCRAILSPATDPTVSRPSRTRNPSRALRSSFAAIRSFGRLSAGLMNSSARVVAVLAVDIHAPSEIRRLRVIVPVAVREPRVLGRLPLRGRRPAVRSRFRRGACRPHQARSSTPLGSLQQCPDRREEGGLAHIDMGDLVIRDRKNPARTEIEGSSSSSSFTASQPCARKNRFTESSA